METKLGTFATTLFGFGLFAAGTCSAITAPLAAAISGRDLLGGTQKSWQARGINFRITWIIVLAIGLVFSLLKFQPIPAIIMAQAINGVLLPVVTVFLILVMNDRTLLPAAYLNSTWSNIAILFVFGACCALGLDSVWKALENPFPLLKNGRVIFFWLNLLFTFGMLLWLSRKIWGKGKSVIN
jgi:Mn2+/Fe2+ NRAMP family transporter